MSLKQGLGELTCRAAKISFIFPANLVSVVLLVNRFPPHLLTMLQLITGMHY